MKGLTRLSMLTALAVLTGSLAASAQAPLPLPYSESFDGGALPSGWTESHTSVGVPPVQWSVDATPAAPIASGPDGPTFGGSAGSLNYNDGTDFADGVSNSGNVTSPALDTTGAGGTIVVNFQCNYQTETTGGTFDVRQMQVLDSVSLATISTLNFQGSGLPAPQTCAAMGTYHAHTLTLAIGAATSVRIRFIFNTVDSVGNTFDGWFIDNLNVTCGDVIPPTTPANLSPPDGAVVSPVVLLDWSDSTDTTSCGPGTVAFYVVEVDDDPAFGSIDFTASPTVSNATTTPLVPATWYWRVRAVDGVGNTTPNSTVTTFIVEPPYPPTADGLFVNESAQGAQGGEAGFVDPVIDEAPAFSAVYRDLNTFDSAIALRFQVSADPTFTILDFDSGTVAIVPTLPKDARTQDLTININLQRDSVYYWRIQFTDSTGLTGPFSAAQSFRIGDDFEFGVRNGSSHHGRRCYVATAAWGGVTPEVAGLTGWRASSIETTAAGRLASRWYATSGAVGAHVVVRTPAATRFALAPLAAAAGSPGLCGTLAALLLAVLVGAACRRW